MSTIQYTIRGIPPETDAKLRRLASLRNQSLNQVVLEQLSSSKLNASKRSTHIVKSKVNTDFDDLFGSITPLAPEVEAALSSQRVMNPKIGNNMGLGLLVLDTNYYSALAKNDPGVGSLIRNSEEIALPHTVIGELLGGFNYGSQFDKNYNDLKRVLAKPTCRVLMPSIETVNIYGRLYADLKKRGKMIPTNDIWIAALTIEYEGTLATYDKDFSAIQGIKLV